MLIAQITDTHIVPKGREWKSLPETRVAARLRLVVDHLNDLDPKPDVVLLTGDAIDDGGQETYDHLKEILNPLSMPLYVIPGNHDDREAMRAAFHKGSYMPHKGFIHYVIDSHAVRLIALDTVVPGKIHGLLCQQRVDWLAHTLQKNTGKPTLIFMHHPVIKVGQKVVDHDNCFTPDRFEDIIRAFPNIIGIIAGHNHRPFMRLFGETLCFTAPSVAPQFHCFEEGNDNYSIALDITQPSFTLHKWAGGFHLVSEIVQAVQPEERLCRKKLVMEDPTLPSFPKHAAGY